MQEKSKSMKKITLSLDEQTLDLLDVYVKANYLNSKSQAIRVLVNKDADRSKDGQEERR